MNVNKVSNQNFSGIKYSSFKDCLDISNKLADRYKLFSSKWWQLKDRIAPVANSKSVFVEITGKGDVLVKEGANVFASKGETITDKFLSAIRKARAIIRKQNPEELEVKVPLKKQFEEGLAKNQEWIEKYRRDLKRPIDYHIVSIWR